MRISDWSSDVCSSDLRVQRDGRIWRLSLDDRRLSRSGCRLSLHLVGEPRLLRRTRDRRRPRRSARPDVTYDPGGDRVRSEEHTSELQSLMRISYAVFCLKKKKR